MKGLVEFIKEQQNRYYTTPIKEKGLHKITIGDYLNGGLHNYEVNVIYAVNDENQLRKDEAVIIINDPKNKHKYQDFFLNKDEWKKSWRQAGDAREETESLLRDVLLEFPERTTYACATRRSQAVCHLEVVAGGCAAVRGVRVSACQS